MAGASDFPAVDVRLVLWLNLVEEAGFENFPFSFLEAGLPHPSDSNFPGILI